MPRNPRREREVRRALKESLVLVNLVALLTLVVTLLVVTLT